MKRHIFKTILTALLVGFILISGIPASTVTASAGSASSKSGSDAFRGSRIVTYEVDKSDLENFIDGGRTAFDILLRKNAPSWLQYELYARDRTVYLTINFDFDSFEDYSEKTKKLLMFSPALVYTTETGLLLMEGHAAIELLNFMQLSLALPDTSMEQFQTGLFSVTQNSILINSVEYSTEDNRLIIRPDNGSIIKFNALTIDTTGKKNGTFTRTITAQIDGSEQSKEDLDALMKRFKKAGKTTSTDLYDNVIEVSVVINAYNQKELLSKTMECLNAAVSVSETLQYVDDATVGVTRTEFIDIADLMKEDSNYIFTYTYPSFYNNVITLDNTTAVTEKRITTQNNEYLSYYYERGFRFDAIDIETDLSNLFGKISRKITLSASADSASDYYDVIKEQLLSRLIKGTTLNIYDKDGSRYYELSYSSWFAKDIENFTNSVLNGIYRLSPDNSWIPCGKVNLQDKISVGNIVPKMAPADETTFRYILPSVINDETVIQFSDGDNINFEYRQLNIIKCLIELLAVIAIVIIVIVVVLRIKKKLRSKRLKSDAT